MSSWIGVDLDGTLAYYDEWRGVEHIGAPIPEMVDRVKRWIAEGREVRIFTARIAATVDAASTVLAIERWCSLHLGTVLPVTCVKDFGMVELWDDRAVQVGRNTGKPVGYSTRNLEPTEGMISSTFQLGPDWERVTVEVAKDGSGVYVRRSDAFYTGSKEAHEAVVVDLDGDGNAIGVEILASPVPSPE